MLHILALLFYACNNQIILFGPNGIFFFPPDSRLTEISTNNYVWAGWGCGRQKSSTSYAIYSLESSRKEESLRRKLVLVCFE